MSTGRKYVKLNGRTFLEGSKGHKAELERQAAVDKKRAAKKAPVATLEHLQEELAEARAGRSVYQDLYMDQKKRGDRLQALLHVAADALVTARIRDEVLF